MACADIDGPGSRCGPEDTGSFSCLFFGELHLGSSSHTVPSSPSQTRTRQKQPWDPSLMVTTEQSHRGLPEQPRVTPFASWIPARGISWHNLENRASSPDVVKSFWYSCFAIIRYTEHSSVVQSLSRVWLFVTWWTAARQASLSITNSQSLLKPMSIESVMPSSRLILCRPRLLLPPIPPRIRVFSKESTLHIRWPKYWSFSFNISPSNEHPGLISFRMDWLDLLAVQGTLKSLLQNHSSKASIIQCSVFFTVQLSHPYLTTGKAIDLTRRTFVDKVMSLLFNMLSRLVITFDQNVWPSA